MFDKLCLLTLIVIGCSVLSYYALRRYFKFKHNHEYLFFWGLSFILFAIYHALFEFALLAPNLVPIDFKDSISIIYLIALCFQFFAISYVTSWCKHNGQCDLCTTCTKKKYRVVVTTILILIVIASQLLPAIISQIYPHPEQFPLTHYVSNFYCLALAVAMTFSIYKYKVVNIYAYYSYLMLTLSSLTIIYGVEVKNAMCGSFDVYTESALLFFLLYICTLFKEFYMPKHNKE